MIGALSSIEARVSYRLTDERSQRLIRRAAPSGQTAYRRLGSRERLGCVRPINVPVAQRIYPSGHSGMPEHADADTQDQRRPPPS